MLKIIEEVTLQPEEGNVSLPEEINESKSSSFINMHGLLDVLERLGHNFRIPLQKRSFGSSNFLSAPSNEKVNPRGSHVAIFREDPRGCLLLWLKGSENPKGVKIYKEQIQGVQNLQGTNSRGFSNKMALSKGC